MAKKNIQKFYTHIKQEGDAGATRGKIPVQMAREMGAGDGDIIMWEVQNGDVVGGSVLSKADKKEYLRENARSTSSARKATPPAKTKAKAKASKPVVKSKTSGTKTAKAKPVVKSKKRKTAVSFDEDERPAKKGKFKVKKRS